MMFIFTPLDRLLQGIMYSIFKKSLTVFTPYITFIASCVSKCLVNNHKGSFMKHGTFTQHNEKMFPEYFSMNCYIWKSHSLKDLVVVWRLNRLLDLLSEIPEEATEQTAILIQAFIQCDIPKWIIFQKAS